MRIQLHDPRELRNNIRHLRLSCIPIRSDDDYETLTGFIFGDANCCKRCGKPFHREYYNQEYCSKYCKWKNNRKDQKC